MAAVSGLLLSKPTSSYVQHDENAIDSDDDENSVKKRSAASAAGAIDCSGGGGAATTRQFDPVTFDVLMVEPSDFASQITLIDAPVFKKIQAEELASCGWNTKEKLSVAPNVVAFTRRFNHICLWCQKEILSRDTPRSRADVVGHFIRIAKKLMDLKNFHASFAVVSGLQSVPIYRLTKTWHALSSKERATFDKLAKMFSEDNNWERLRQLLDSVKLPCLPYLGIFLTDLMYIDVAHPKAGSIGRNRRSTQMNNILRLVAEYQFSDYSDLCPVEYICSYLESVRYIDELQKFVEEDLYKKSITLEPDELALRRRESLPVNVFHSCSKKTPLLRSPAMSNKKQSVPLNVFHKTQSLTPQLGHHTASVRKASDALTKGHRKTNSLGNPAQLACLYTNQSFCHNVDDGGELHNIDRLNLLDDSLRDFSSTTCTTSTLSSNQQEVPINDSGHETSDDVHTCCSAAPPHFYADDTEDDDVCLEKETDTLCQQATKATAVAAGQTQFTIESAVRRKTQLKAGKAPRVSPWCRYWISLWGTNLLYFSTRSLPSRNYNARSAYKNKPAKVVSICGWMAFLSDDRLFPDAFQLQEPSRGDVYKFRAGSLSNAMEWVDRLKVASEQHRQKLPDNLMSFD